MNKEVLNKFETLVKKLIEKKLTITFMESCTGGQLASYTTDIEGSSAVIKGAFVTYANDAKILNGVSENIINTKGVYSFDTARSMALASLNTYKADIGVGVTGTFANLDENNKDSVINNVFVSILYKNAYHDLGIKVSENIQRYIAKDEVALRFAEELLKLI